MNVTATQAKNRFGALCAHAKTKPVFVEKDGRVDTVILSFQQFELLQTGGQGKALVQRHRAFEQTHKAWIAEQKARVARPQCGSAQDGILRGPG